MKSQLSPFKLILLIAAVMAMGFLLKPTFSTAGDRVLLSGTITKTRDNCNDQKELLSSGKTVSIAGVCDSGAGIVLDNEQIIVTDNTPDLAAEKKFAKHDDNWVPGQAAYVIAQKESKKGQTVYSLACDSCRVWTVR